MNISILINNFSSGEVSPILSARPDTQAFNYGAKRLENFLPMETGGIRKRPGTWFMGNTKDNAKARLIDFPLSDGTYVIGEITTNTIRLWKNDGTIKAAITLTTPYAEDKIKGIKYAIQNDSIWLVHPDYAPIRITRIGDAFTLSTPTFTGTDFSTPGNYPAAIAFHKGRLWFAATNNKPNTIFASKAPSAETGTYQYTDFTLGHIASDAISLEENDMYGSKLKWIAANRLLLAATDRATWSDTGDVPTPATFDMNIIEYVGSEDMQGRGTKEALVYVGRSGKTLRALLFTVNSGNAGYIDTDISEAARHVLVKGILDFCIIEYPFSMVWIVLNDGSLVSCTLNMRAGVVAYARHPMTGTVESIAAVPGTDGDALWMVINRGNKRFVEKLVVGEVTGTEYQESHYVDSGTRIELTRASKTITGLTHLAGMEVHALGDGSIMPPRTVTADGSIIYDTPVTMLHAGLPYTSVLVPTSPEIPANGTSIGKKRRIEKVMLRLYESYGGKCGIDHERLQILGYMKYGDYIMGSAPEPFTGDQDITISGTIDTVGKIMVIHDEPVPFNLLGLVERIAIMEA